MSTMVAAMNNRTELENLELLGWIMVTSQGIHVSQDFVRQLVAVARQKGVSWGDIGTALGVTRQAAAKKYRDV